MKLLALLWCFFFAILFSANYTRNYLHQMLKVNTANVNVQKKGTANQKWNASQVCIHTSQCVEKRVRGRSDSANKRKWWQQMHCALCVSKSNAYKYLILSLACRLDNLHRPAHSSSKIVRALRLFILVAFNHHRPMWARVCTHWVSHARQRWRREWRLRRPGNTHTNYAALQ